MSHHIKIDQLVKLLNTYSGRDSIMRTIGYASLYLSANTSGISSRNLKTIYEQLGYCRLILRLFDDLPMLQFTLSYGLGSKDENVLLRMLGVIKNLLDQVYYPIEHVAWAADKKLIRANSSVFYLIGTALWGVSSYVGIIRSVILISTLQRQTKGMKNVVLHEKIVGQQLELLLLAIKDAFDAAIAIHYLPYGSLLWAGKLDQKKIGLFGTISSLLRLLMLWKNLKSDE